MAGRPAREATLEERRDLMLAHFEAIESAAHDPKEALHKLRTMTGWYTNGLPHGRALRIRISELLTPADFRDAVTRFFDGLASMATPADAIAS
jgi:tRNA-dihydrouridine synthase